MTIESPWDETTTKILEPVNHSLVDKDQLRLRIKKALQGAYARGFTDGRRHGRDEVRQEIKDSL